MSQVQHDLPGSLWWVSGAELRPVLCGLMIFRDVLYATGRVAASRFGDRKV